MKTQHPAAHASGKVARRLLQAALFAGGLAPSIALAAAANASTHAAAAKDSKEVTVVMDAKRGNFGTILVTTSGITLYTYGKDTKDHSNVTGTVLSAWPALTIPAGKAPEGTRITSLGEIQSCSNGQEQVTYRSQPPLPLHRRQEGVGQVTGQGINHFSVVRLGSNT